MLGFGAVEHPTKAITVNVRASADFLIYCWMLCAKASHAVGDKHEAHLA